MQRNTRIPTSVSQNRAGALNAAGVFNRETSSTGSKRENKFQVEFKLELRPVAFNLLWGSGEKSASSSNKWKINNMGKERLARSHWSEKALFWYFFSVSNSCSITYLTLALLAALF